MKVQDLIDLLNKIEDKNDNVEVVIHQYNKVGYVAYCAIDKPMWDRFQNVNGSHRIEIQLPTDEDSFTILSKRKKT